MSFTTHFKCKQNEKHDFPRFLILDRITDTNITNGESGIKLSWVDFFKKLIFGGGTFIRDSRVIRIHRRKLF